MYFPPLTPSQTERTQKWKGRCEERAELHIPEDYPRLRKKNQKKNIQIESFCNKYYTQVCTISIFARYEHFQQIIEQI